MASPGTGPTTTKKPPSDSSKTGSKSVSTITNTSSINSSKNIAKWKKSQRVLMLTKSQPVQSFSEPKEPPAAVVGTKDAGESAGTGVVKPPSADSEAGPVKSGLYNLTAVNFAKKLGSQKSLGLQNTDPGLRPLYYVPRIRLHDLDPAYPCRPFNVTHWNKNYQIFNLSKRIYVGKEESSNCSIFCFRNNRPFQVMISKPKEEPIIRIRRKYNCSLCFWGTRLYGSKVTIDFLPSNSEVPVRLGTVKQVFRCCTPKYKILDGAGMEIMDVYGPKKSCPSLVHPYPNEDFPVFEISYDDNIDEEKQIGKIYMELDDEIVVTGSSDDIAGKTIRVSLSVKFARKLTPEDKVLIIATAICMDFNYFGEGCCEPLPGVWILVMVIVFLVFACTFGIFYIRNFFHIHGP